MNKRKSITSIVIAFAIILSVLAVPSFNSQAASSLVSKPTGLKQVGTVKGKSISWKWNSVNGATGYSVSVWAGSEYGGWVVKNATVKTTSYTYKTKKLGMAYIIYVYAIDKNGDRSEYAFRYGYSYPVKPTKTYVYKWTPNSSQVVLRWMGYAKGNNILPGGYQVEVYSLAGKKLKTYAIKAETNQDKRKNSSYYDVMDKKITGIKNQGFKVRIRAYRKLDSGEKIYGAWSKTECFVPQAKIKGYGPGANSNYKSVNWLAVKDAVSYSIYYMDGSTPKLIKSGIKSTTYNKLKYNYATSDRRIFITADVKVKGKVYKSTVTKQGVVTTSYSTTY